jgi:Cu/Ag efflux protein CusF
MKKSLVMAAVTVLAAASVSAVQARPWTVADITAREPTIQLIHDNHGGATEASGVIDAVDAAQRKVTVSHGSIQKLGWPAMTMEFPVNKEIDLTAVKAGMKVNFTLVKGSSGAWTVDTLKPATKQ